MLDIAHPPRGVDGGRVAVRLGHGLGIGSSIGEGDPRVLLHRHRT